MAARHMLRAIWLDKTERELIRAALGTMYNGIVTHRSRLGNADEVAACIFTASQIEKTLALFNEPKGADHGKAQSED